jgi:hypothetical protein
MMMKRCYLAQRICPMACVRLAEYRQADGCLGASHAHECYQIKGAQRVQIRELIHICPNPEVQVLFGGICSPSGVSIGPNSCSS